MVKPCYLRVGPARCKPNCYRITLKSMGFEDHTCSGTISPWIRPNGGPFPWNRVGGAAACARGLDHRLGPEPFPRLSVVNGEAPSAQPCSEALTVQELYSADAERSKSMFTAGAQLGLTASDGRIVPSREMILF